MSRTVRIAATFACALVATTSCAITADDEPRALAVTTTTTTEPATPTVGGSTAVLWMLDDGQLVPLSLSLPDHMVSTVLGALFDPSSDTDEQHRGLTSSVPVDARLEDVELNGGTLTVNMSEEFDNVVGPSRQQAIAQIVLTATEFPNIERVRFEVDGEPVQVATPTRGDAGTVTACDYVSLLADPTNTTQSTVDDDTRERLAERTATLETTCVPT